MNTQLLPSYSAHVSCPLPHKLDEWVKAYLQPQQYSIRIFGPLKNYTNHNEDFLIVVAYARR